MCVGVKEQNIYFLFILVVIRSLMCKPEQQFQLGKS